MFTGSLKMAKRSSASSRPARLISMKAESIFNKPLTKRQQQVLDRLATRPESEIDYSDIPPLSEEQLASAFRPKSKQLIAVRLDREALRIIPEGSDKKADPYAPANAQGVAIWEASHSSPIRPSAHLASPQATVWTK